MMAVSLPGFGMRTCFSVFCELDTERISSPCAFECAFAGMEAEDTVAATDGSDSGLGGVTRCVACNDWLGGVAASVGSADWLNEVAATVSSGSKV